MKAFEYYKVKSSSEAVSLLKKFGERAAILAGGSDLIGLLKDGITGPKFDFPKSLIDIKECEDLRFIKESRGGVKIGAAMTISELISSPVINRKCPLLVSAAKQIAVPQIRNVGTVGGNLCQRPRCWYFRGPLFRDCFRKGGNHCFAPGGENQYHAIIGSDKCFMVYPSDLAVILMALKARVEIAGPKGRRVVPIDRFYLSPVKSVLRENILSPQEMVTGIEIPPEAGIQGTYLKLKERQAFDFAVVSVALTIRLKEDVVSECRIVWGGVAPYPYRDLRAELAAKGKTKGEAGRQALASALGEAQPLSGNAYKVMAAKGLLTKAFASL